jgi:ubiquitin C-terminal hydrolase
LEAQINFPLEGLDMSDYVQNQSLPEDLFVKRSKKISKSNLIASPNKAIYDLYAVSNHYGGLGGGHYTAFGKNKRNNEWYKFDDTIVSKVVNLEKEIV